MSEQTSVASPPATTAPATSAPATTAPAAPAASPAPATAAATAAAIAAPAATAPDAAQALTDARAYLKGVVADEKALEGKSDAEVLALAQGAKALADKHGTAPEKYEAFKAPDGMTLNTVVVAEFEVIAKELGLSQGKAQTLVDKLGPTIAKQNEASLAITLAKADADWSAASKADPEFGGDKFDENLAIAKRALDTFGSPELTKLLNDSRMGNHPEWIRFSHRVGKALSADGKHITGSPQGQGEKPLAERLWPAKTT